MNKTSEIQSVVYCLATNYLIQVDKAAKRVGRFDLQIPIYHPDPMSRVGVFLYRLIAILQSEEKQDKRPWREHLQELERDGEFWRRTHEVIVKTMGVSAQSLATIFFARATNSFFNYVLNESPKCPLPTPEKGRADIKTPVEEDIENQRAQFEETWKRRMLAADPKPSAPRDKQFKAMSVGRRVRI